MDQLINNIVCSDCVEYLKGIEKSFADLIFADPPFNIGYFYDKYEDTLEKDAYIKWTREWMSECVKVLKNDGTFFIAIGDEYAANVKILADELGLYMRNWLIWHYTFGQQMKNKFSRSHTHIFYFVKDKDNFKFNDEAVRVPSDRQLIYKDKRANPRGKMPDDVWSDFSRVCGTFKERQGWHPCQMPEDILKRIIAVSTNKNDIVFDPFSGSGTTAAASYMLERNYAGIDISEEYVERSKKRLQKLKEQKKRSDELDLTERAELKRLAVEFGRDIRDIIKNKNLITFFADQFKLRMNGKNYKIETLRSALKELAG